MNGSAYVTEDIIDDNWEVYGGTINLKGLKRQYEFGGFKYVGKEALEVYKVSYVVKIKQLLGLLPEERLSMSSIGDSEKWTISNGFEYGPVNGETHSLDVLRTYLISDVVIQIILEKEDGTETQTLTIPVK
jgi:hypothetical protein